MLTSPPNLLSISRILLIPVLVALFYVPGDWARWLACVVFVIAATTDFFDGWLARNWQMQSPLGRWLDPVADKLLVAAVIVMLVAFDRAPVLPAMVIVLREITVSGLREYLAEVSVGMPVSRLAKWKTAFQMVAIVFLLLGSAGPAWLPVEAIGGVAIWIAAVLTLVTGWDYLQKGLRHMTSQAGDAPAQPLRSGAARSR